jgi:hypothetical protein
MVWLNRNVKKFEKKNLNSNILYINFLSQLKSRILADFERLPIMKFNEYWCNNDLALRFECKKSIQKKMMW